MDDPLVWSGLIMLCLAILAMLKNKNYKHTPIPPRRFDPPPFPEHPTPRKQARPPGFNPVLTPLPRKQMTALIPLRFAQAQRREDLN